MRTVFGLDFGTTNSALAVNTQDRTEVIDIDPHNLTEKTMRSVIFVNAVNNIYLGQEVPDVVMGRPVLFSADRNKDILAEGRLKRAAEIAGFKRVAFQLEPVAAALTFENSLPKGTEKIVLIGDFGGGTSDFTVIRLTGGKSGQPDRLKDILSLGGVSIAGDVFDSRLMWEKVAVYFGKDVRYKSITGRWLDMPSPITFKLINWHLIPQLRTNSVKEALRGIKMTADDPAAITNLENLIEDNNGFLLFQALEKAKIELSFSEQSMIFFQEQGLEIRESVGRREFEQAIRGQIEKIAGCIDQTVQKAGLAPGDIDVVFTTGGTSHIPAVRDLFIRRFGEAKMQHRETFTSVAYGLGLSASMFFK